MGSLKRRELYMWTRRELKECAKQLLKINYWKAVLAGVILSLIGGSGVVSVVERSSSGSFDEVIGAVETDDFGLVLGIALVGFQILLGSANDKADGKGKAIGFIIGAIMLFSITTIAKLVISAVE